MNKRKIIRQIHLWLGLVSGIVVFVVSLTGTLFVFCDEVIDLFAGDAKYVEVAPGQTKLSADFLLTEFREKNIDRQPFYFDLYRADNRSFRVASMNQNEGAFSYTYMNPYSGEIIKTTHAYWFFYVVAHIHTELLMHETGKALVGMATIIFFLELIGGFILWFPRRWTPSTRIGSFTLKRKTNWKRKNYDLHKVLGFYALIPAILITVTGLIMAYKVLSDVTYKTFGANTKGFELLKKYEPEYDESKEPKSFQFIVGKNFTQYPKADQCRISFWGNEKATTYYTIVGNNIGLKSKSKGYAFFTDRYTGEELVLPPDVKKHFGIDQTIFDLHVGHWGGLFSKILTFIVGLICTSLPITGLIIWLGKKRKKQKNVITRTE